MRALYVLQLFQLLFSFFISLSLSPCPVEVFAQCVSQLAALFSKDCIAISMYMRGYHLLFFLFASLALKFCCR